MGQTLSGPLVSAAQTEFEIIRDQFWSRLKSGQLDGHHFEYRACIAGHQVDFCCETARLLIDIHPSEGADPALLDERRVAELEAAGYLVLHLWEQDLRRGLDPLLDFIRQPLYWREPTTDMPAPVRQPGHC
jgi:very-short-patch-repair endonuclease